MKGLVIFGLLSMTFAQVPTPCKSPEQWTGKMLRTEQGRRSFERVTYDESQRRIHKGEERDYSTGETQYIDILRLYNENREYRVDRRTRQCNLTTPRRPWLPYGIPPFSTFDYSSTIGAVGVPGESLTLNHFYGKFEDGTTFDGSVTSPDCIPLQLNYNGTWGYEDNAFYDLAMGIVDPMVFIPPTNCTVVPPV